MARVGFYAKRDIENGEELTFTYNYSEELRPFECKCRYHLEEKAKSKKKKAAKLLPKKLKSRLRSQPEKAKQDSSPPFFRSKRLLDLAKNKSRPFKKVKKTKETKERRKIQTKQMAKKKEEKGGGKSSGEDDESNVPSEIVAVCTCLLFIVSLGFASTSHFK